MNLTSFQRMLFVCLSTTILSVSGVLGQNHVKDSCLRAVLVSVSYNAQLPIGHWSETYGFQNVLSGGFGYKTHKNITFGMEGRFLFGNQIRLKGLLDDILTRSGHLIAVNGTLADFSYSLRGFGVLFQAGKVFAFKKPNPNSGIWLSSGAGWMSHRIHFDVDDGLAPQISNDYRKLYDRLSGGLLISHFLGYLILDQYKLLNFYGGIQYDHGFVQGFRSWDETSKNSYNRRFYNGALSFRIAWVLPLYSRRLEKYFYY